MIQNRSRTVVGSASAYRCGSRHLTTMRTVAIVAISTVARSTTTRTIILVVVVTVVATTGSPTRTHTIGVVSARVTTIRTIRLLCHHAIVAVVSVVVVTEVLTVAVGSTTIRTLVN